MYSISFSISEFLSLTFSHQTPGQDVLKHADPNISNSSMLFPTLLPNGIFEMETQSCITFKISQDKF